jgi:hypothetical protein
MEIVTKLLEYIIKFPVETYRSGTVKNHAGSNKLYRQRNPSSE